MTDIFIRTYKNDLKWLAYCLRSIHKYVTGYGKIVVCIPENQKELLKDFNLPHVVTCPIYPNDYIGQQISKLTSYKHIDSEFILFVDSDVCFTRSVNVSEYFKDGKPIIFKTNYQLVGDAKCWQEPTEQILGMSVGFEYMRRLPFLFRRDTLEVVDRIFNCESFYKRERLSEFNLMGAYAEHYEPNNYYFWDTEENPNLPQVAHKQFWSWSGMTEAERNELETLLA